MTAARAELAFLGARRLAALVRERKISPVEITISSIAVPCGFTRSGLPLSLQLIACDFDEATLLRAAHAYEQESGWWKRRPPETS